MKRYTFFSTMLMVLIFQAAGFAYQLGPHPRVLISRQQLPLLAERAIGVSSGEYLALKAAAEKAVREGVKKPGSRFQAPLELVCLGLCYLVEGELGREPARYAEAVKRYWGNGEVLGLDGDGAFGYHSLIYDWIFESLSTDEKKIYGDCLGRWLRHYTGEPEITLKSGHWWYNQTWGPSHLNTPHARDAITSKLFISLALKGAGTVHEADAARFLDSWSERVPKECIPAFDEMGGVWSESMGHGTYGPVEVIAWAFEAWRTATGEDYFSLAGPDGFLREMNLWAVHLTVPFNGHTACIDDNGGGKPRVFSRVAPLLAARFRDPLSNNVSDLGAREGWTEVPWTRFIFHDPSITARTPTELGIPLAHLFKGAGHVYMRSRWDDPNATWAFFGAGPKFAGHSRDDEGHFLIARKGWLVMRAGGQGSNEDNLYAGGSLMFNLVTVYDPEEQFRRTDKPQRPDGPQVVKNENDGGLIRHVYGSNTRDNRARIESYYHDDRMTYAAADLTEGYSANKVSEVTRQFLYLRGEREFFVIFDRIQSTNDDFPRTWFLHMSGEPAVSGKELVLVPGHVFSYNGDTATWLSDPAGLGEVKSTGRSRAFLRTLLPKMATIVKRGGQDYNFWGNPHEPTAQYNHAEANSGQQPPVVPWRIEVEGPGDGERGYFLHVLEIGEELDDKMSEISLLEENAFVGARIDAAGTPVNVLFSARGELLAKIKIGAGPEMLIEK
ncbi:MAG: hypothetical protein V1794_07670 [Candidatus Glassbacteria bacterium]